MAAKVKDALCPHCGKKLESSFIASSFSSLGRGKSKARSSEQARKAVMARWAKKRHENSQRPKQD